MSGGVHDNSQPMAVSQPGQASRWEAPNTPVVANSSERMPWNEQHTPQINAHRENHRSGQPDWTHGQPANSGQPAWTCKSVRHPKHPSGGELQREDALKQTAHSTNQCTPRELQEQEITRFGFRLWAKQSTQPVSCVAGLALISVYESLLAWTTEGDDIFNDTSNTFYLQLFSKRTIQIARVQTRCHHYMSYSFQLAARDFSYAQSHRQDSTYHDLCYTNCRALAGMRNSSVGPLWACCDMFNTDALIDKNVLSQSIKPQEK